MFDFRKEVIINSNVFAEDPTLARVQITEATDAAPAMLRVLRCADYELSKIQNVVVVPAKIGKRATVQLVDKKGSAVLVEIVLGLDEHRMHGEFANPWSNHEKVIRFECANGAIADQVAALKDAIVANPIVTVTDGGLVTCKDVHAIVKSAVIYVVTEAEEGVQKLDAGSPLTPNNGERPVNTGELLTENLRFPSYPNLRYAAEHEEERPIAGELYDLYVFDYVVPRVGLHGQGAVGQQITSATTHAFYVRKGIYTSENNPFEKITGKGDEVPVAGE